MAIELDIVKFREWFPAFANEVAFPDARITMYFERALCYISGEENCELDLTCQEQAVYLMTAHLLALSIIVANGQVPSLKQAASIDKISVSLSVPPLQNQWQWWLSLTSYGQELFALLQIASVGGFYFGGLPETTALRKFAGIY